MKGEPVDSNQLLKQALLDELEKIGAPGKLDLFLQGAKHEIGPALGATAGAGLAKMYGIDPLAGAAAGYGLGASHDIIKGIRNRGKTAGVLGTFRQAIKAPGGVRDHLTEIGGLGLLAAPGVDTLQAHARARMAGDTTTGGVAKKRLLGDAAHAALDVGGLGVLMGPEFKHLRG